jgi:tetratricopeptide (TPR) repeat protein
LASHTKHGGIRLGRCLAALILLAAVACARGGDLEQQLSELRSLQNEGKSAETLDELTELARLHPENAEVSFRLGLAMIAVGRATEAVFPLRKATDADEFAVPAGIVLASTLSQTGNHAAALRAAERVLEHEAENETALVLRATAAVELHDGAAALESAERLVEKAPDNRTYRFVRASALAESARLDEAEAMYRELLDDAPAGQPQVAGRACQALVRFLLAARKAPDRAVAEVKACIESHPDDPDMVTMLAGFLQELERRDDLIAILQGALEDSPDSPKLRESLVDELTAADRVDEAKQLTEKWASEGEDSTSWRQAATLRRRTGDLPGALEAVEKAISLSPTPEDELRFFETELLIELGRLDEAEAKLESIASPLYRDVLTGRLAQERGDAKTALELYGKAAIDWPQNFGLRVLAARAAFSLGDTERAKSDLQEATRQAPKDTDAALWLAHIYFSEGNFGQAVAYAGRQLKERGPIDAGAHVLMAQALAEARQMPRAMKALEDLEKVRDGKFRSIAWATAAALTERSDPAAALAELERKTTGAKLDLGDPAESVVLDQLFDLLVKNGKAGEAENRIDRLLAKRPDSPHLHALRGRIALIQGQPERAEQEFARALELEPKEATALSGFALLYQAKGDLPKAIARMNEAAGADPASGDYAYMAAHMTLTLGDRPAAMEKFEAILREHPEQVGAANDLAFLLAEDAADLPRAQQYAERAVRLRPSAETLDTLGFVKLRQGAAEEAVGLFERALARQPEYSTARYHLALALVEKGEPQAARKALEEALSKSFPEEQEARKVLAQIDSGEGRP